MKPSFSNLTLVACGLFAAVAVILSSCGKRTSIDGTLENAPESEVVVRLLDVNRYETLDTLTTDRDGRFSYKMDIAKGQPEFVYLFHNDTKIASLLLERGDRVTVSADTLGKFTVTGSDETDKLVGVEKDLADFSSRMAGIVGRMDAAKPGSDAYKAANRELTEAYIGYYRDRMRYVMSNPFSLTVVPVFFQMVSENMPVFSQETDAITFSNICDSLETVYADSRYVKALRREADRRMNILTLGIKMKDAKEMAYPDIVMPDVTGQKIRLSEVEGKVVLVHFWSASDAAQKMFNLDVLKPVYEDYHAKGLEIYQIALDADKGVWARVVKDQGLDWINVCDGLGAASPEISIYNITSLPTSFVIASGSLVEEKISDEASLRRLLGRLLK